MFSILDRVNTLLQSPALGSRQRTRQDSEIATAATSSARSRSIDNNHQVDSMNLAFSSAWSARSALKSKDITPQLAASRTFLVA